MNHSTENTNTPAQSPCIDQCVLDSQKICTGCFRTIDEIIEWSQHSESEKRDTLKKCSQRKASAN